MASSSNRPDNLYRDRSQITIHYATDRLQTAPETFRIGGRLVRPYYIQVWTPCFKAVVNVYLDSQKAIVSGAMPAAAMPFMPSFAVPAETDKGKKRKLARLAPCVEVPSSENTRTMLRCSY